MMPSTRRPYHPNSMPSARSNARNIVTLTVTLAALAGVTLAAVFHARRQVLEAARAATRG